MCLYFSSVLSPSPASALYSILWGNCPPCWESCPIATFLGFLIVSWHSVYSLCNVFHAAKYYHAYAVRDVGCCEHLSHDWEGVTAWAADVSTLTVKKASPLWEENREAGKERGRGGEGRHGGCNEEGEEVLGAWGEGERLRRRGDVPEGINNWAGDHKALADS